MNRSTSLRAAISVLIFVLGNLQAWDSDVPEAGLMIVLLVSIAIALPPVALLLPLNQTYFVGAFALSFLFLLLARLTSPIALPELFIVLVPAAMGLVFAGIMRQEP